MSSVDPAGTPPVGHVVQPYPAPRHARSVGDVYVVARRWAVGVLVLATLALVAYVAAIGASVWLMAWALELVRPGTVDGGVDVGALVLDALPALLVGWCAGFAALAGLSRDEGIGPRLTGVAAGLVGTLAGAGVLALGPLL